MVVVYYFVLEERIKDVERETKIRRMGLDCFNRFGSTFFLNEVIIYFFIRVGRGYSLFFSFSFVGSAVFLFFYGLITFVGFL